jgi:hypothetical protein
VYSFESLFTQHYANQELSTLLCLHPLFKKNSWCREQIWVRIVRKCNTRAYELISQVAIDEGQPFQNFQNV